MTSKVMSLKEKDNKKSLKKLMNKKVRKFPRNFHRQKNHKIKRGNFNNKLLNKLRL